MRHKLLTLVLAVAVIASLTVVGCTKPSPPAPAPEILVGLPAALTGMYAGFGQGHVFGAKAAVEDINNQGGVYVKEYNRRLPINLLVVDTESDTNKAGTLAEGLVLNDKVKFLITGDEPPPMHAPVAIISERYKIPHLAQATVMEPWLAMRSEVTSHWPYTWAFGFSIATPPPAGDFRHGKLGYTILDTWKTELDMFGGQTNKRVGVFASDDGDGRGWYALFPPALEKWGYDVIGVENKLGLFPMGTTDFTSLIEKWMDNNVEILWGNCPAPDFGTLWRQCYTLGLKPKIVTPGRAASNYIDVIAWGGDLPLGIGQEIKWLPSYQGCYGIGDTTAQSLFERWHEETGRPADQNVGLGYYVVQVLIDAIERAGTLDANAINKALAETDMMTMNWRVKFDENQFSLYPLTFGQWQKTDSPEAWELRVVFSQHDFATAQTDMLFPIPYD